MTTVLKIDIDIPELKRNKWLFQTFIDTKWLILEKLGLKPIKVRWTETEKGFHFWFHIKDNISDLGMCDVQFLLGDDQARCRFNYLRQEAGCFRQFNVLFNQKMKHKKGEGQNK